MKPATPKARALLAKLQALAERGINGERDAAIVKLKRLQKRYDFNAKNTGGSDIFAGIFIKSTVAAPVYQFTGLNMDTASPVKWAIEHATGVQCLFRGSWLMAEASTATATKLGGIASIVAGSFETLWTQFKAAPGVRGQDRANFILGLYEGMMSDERRNEPLPSRAVHCKKVKARRRAVNLAPGLALHPYAVALKLGWEIRFAVPLDEIAGQLEAVVKRRINNQKQ